jgi:CubicO group peptidase (beta-lactamase class C family)
MRRFPLRTGLATATLAALLTPAALAGPAQASPASPAHASPAFPAQAFPASSAFPAVPAGASGGAQLPPFSELPQYPLTTVKSSAHPVRLTDHARKLKVTYTFRGHRYTLADFLQRSSTLGFTVLHGTTILDQRFFDGEGRDSYFQSWSVGKSITSAAVGVAYAEGRIHSLSDPVTRYLPQLRRTGYDGVPIVDVLHMASGTKWDESTYTNVFQGALNSQLRLIFGTPLMKIAKESTRQVRPGTVFNYDSLNTYVLSQVVQAATHTPYATFVQQKIWGPAGMASPLYLGHDWSGQTIAYCCYHAQIDDFARFGLLYLRDGRAGGRQVIPSSWVAASTRVDAPYLAPYKLYPGDPFGYGFQWWLGDGKRGDYTGIGLLGQYIYVNPKDDVVIVKTSQDFGSDSRDAELLTAFRAVADAASHLR